MTDVKNLTKLACSYVMSPTALKNVLKIEVLKTSYLNLHIIYSWIFNSCYLFKCMNVVTCLLKLYLCPNSLIIEFAQ